MPMIDRRISTADDVRALATEPESETLDYKSVANPDEWWELAKDIAAFANHLGGVIIVGATEKPDGFPELHGLPVAKIAALKDAYEMAARDKCRPSALMTCERVPWEGGREILAVNVAAYAGGIVGAQFYALNTAGNAEPANAWQFPMRIGKHNPPLPLEQAIMHMSAHVRRTAILLTSIADRNNVKLIWEHPADNIRDMREPAPGALRNFSIERNVAYFVLNDGPLASVTIPIDDLDAVWSEEDGSWAVRVSGYFEELSNDAGGYDLTYIPRRRRGCQ